MKKINIKDLELNIDITHILNLYASKAPIIIDVDGKIYNNASIFILIKNGSSIFRH